MHYVISGLKSSDLAHLYCRDDYYLVQPNTRRVLYSPYAALPARIGMKDVASGRNGSLL